jgi:hypothetical protein
MQISLKLYQQLTQFHLNNKYTNALIDLTINRLNWAYEKIECTL